MKSIFKQALPAALAGGGASAGLFVQDAFDHSLRNRDENGGVLETITRPVTPPPATQFFRLHPATP